MKSVSNVQIVECISNKKVGGANFLQPLQFWKIILRVCDQIRHRTCVNRHRRWFAVMKCSIQYNGIINTLLFGQQNQWCDAGLLNNSHTSAYKPNTRRAC